MTTDPKEPLSTTLARVDAALTDEALLLAVSGAIGEDNADSGSSQTTLPPTSETILERMRHEAAERNARRDAAAGAPVSVGFREPPAPAFPPANELPAGLEVSRKHPTPLPSSGMREMGKLGVHLVPAEFNLLLAAVLDYGAQKYAPHNFEKGMDPDDLLRGAESHLMAIKAGEIYDFESGLPHAGHAAWNMLTFAMQMMREPALEELFVNVLLRRRAGKLVHVAREYAAKHGYEAETPGPEFDATPWRERVALLRNTIKPPPSTSGSP